MLEIKHNVNSFVVETSRIEVFRELLIIVKKLKMRWFICCTQY